jgi:hypothetical protein
MVFKQGQTFLFCNHAPLPPASQAAINPKHQAVTKEIPGPCAANYCAVGVDAPCSGCLPGQGGGIYLCLLRKAPKHSPFCVWRGCSLHVSGKRHSQEEEVGLGTLFRNAPKHCLLPPLERKLPCYFVILKKHQREAPLLFCFF